MTTSNALTVPSKIKPKPTKAEIIDALTQLQIAKLTKQKREAVATADQLRAKVDARLVKAVRSNIDKLATDVSYGWTQDEMRDGKRVLTGVSHVSVRFDLRDLPEEAVALLLKYHTAKAEASICIDDKRIRKQIAQAATGFGSRGERVSAMLGDEESRKALEAMLQSIS